VDGSSTTKEGVEKQGIRQIIREEIRTYFQDPLGYEKEFKGWLPEWIGQSGIDIPISQVIGFNQFVNKLVDVDVLMTAVSHINWNQLNVDNLAIYNGYKLSTVAQNNEINYDISLSAGTWDIELLHVTGANQGIYTITLDDIACGTIDGYSAGTAYNVRTSLTGVIVPDPRVYRLKLKMATKNASSANYQGLIQHIQLRRTD
jgi:hypothetical protein